VEEEGTMVADPEPSAPEEVSQGLGRPSAGEAGVAAALLGPARSQGLGGAGRAVERVEGRKNDEVRWCGGAEEGRRTTHLTFNEN
jgi:hypothetical protein